MARNAPAAPPEPRTSDLRLHVQTHPLTDATAWRILAQAQGQPRFWWADGEDEAVGIGVAARLDADGPGRVAHLLAQARQVLGAVEGGDAADLRFFGGLAFDPRHAAAGPWSAFPSARFILPRRLVTWRQGRAAQTTIHVDGAPIPDDEPTHPTAAPTLDEPLDHQHRRWMKAVARILAGIQDGSLTKVVLARAERRPPHPDLSPVLGRLARTTEPASRFLIEPVPGHAFWGASPELLVRRHGHDLETLALAGSAPRGATGEEDDALARRLTANPKDALEHELVVSYLMERLANVHAHAIRHDARRVLRLTHVQHLETRIGARLGPGLHVLELADTLHPTPAVGGLPLEAALDAIDALEAAPRGWYAGAVGWFDGRGDGRLVTAIRSALTTPEATWLYAGAGIVAGSDAQAEWDETRLKLLRMDQALAGDAA